MHQRGIGIYASSLKYDFHDNLKQSRLNCMPSYWHTLTYTRDHNPLYDLLIVKQYIHPPLQDPSCESLLLDER